ncbi:cytochrome p450 81d11, partial [Quercus suber]
SSLQYLGKGYYLFSLCLSPNYCSASPWKTFIVLLPCFDPLLCFHFQTSKPPPQQKFTTKSIFSTNNWPPSAPETATPQNTRPYHCSTSILIVSSPSAVEECFTKNDKIFANRPQTMAGDRLTYNCTAPVWAPYGHLWRNLRRVSTIEIFSHISLQKSSSLEKKKCTLLFAKCLNCQI